MTVTKAESFTESVRIKGILQPLMKHCNYCGQCLHAVSTDLMCLIGKELQIEAYLKLEGRA